MARKPAIDFDGLAAQVDWITAPDAAKLLRVSPNTVRRRAVGLGIRQREFGVARYCREDVERLAREQVAPLT